MIMDTTPKNKSEKINDTENLQIAHLETELTWEGITKAVANIHPSLGSLLREMCLKIELTDERSLRNLRAIEAYIVEEQKKAERDIQGEPKWPSYASEDFEKIRENLMGLENAGDDKSQILYHIMEIETLLGRTEEKARVINRKYEARLAASLRDICRVHEPKDFTKEQINCFGACLTALIEGWSKLNKEKVRWIRYQLLDVGLTWLPVTDKAVKDILEAQKAKG